MYGISKATFTGMKHNYDAINKNTITSQNIMNLESGKKTLEYLIKLVHFYINFDK